jgi:hypothetical protein
LPVTFAQVYRHIIKTNTGDNKMKAQINNQIRRQTILVLLVMCITTGSFAQKATIALKENFNIKQLKNFFEVLDNQGMNDAGQYLQLSELSDAIYGSIGSEIDKMIFALEMSAGDIFMFSKEEEELVVEDWMLDENHFRTTGINYEINETAEEENPVIEDWMLDESHFLSDKANLNPEEDAAEEKLQVENWMLDQNHWVLGAK